MSSFVERTEADRRQQVGNIIRQLNEHQLTPSIEALRNLYKHFNTFIKTGERIEINEKLPELTIPRRMRGLLTNNAKEDCYIKFSLMTL